MNTFYILDGDKPSGPYTLLQLRERGIDRSTMVWDEERSAWIEAGEISGFDTLFLPSSAIEEVETGRSLEIFPELPTEGAENPQAPAEGKLSETSKLKKASLILVGAIVADTIVVVAGLYAFVYVISKTIFP